MSLIDKLKAQLQDSYELTRESRKEADRALEYFHGNQIPDDVKAVLEGRGQPEMWENMCDRIVSKISGLKGKVNTEITAIGRQRVDAPLAAVVTDSLRAIQDNEAYELAKEQTDEDLLVWGVHVREMHLKVSRNTDLLGYYEKEIKVPRGDPKEYFFDPYSKEPTYSDGRYMHRVFWIDKERLYDYFDEAKVDTLIAGNDFSPMGSRWEENYLQHTSSSERERVMVCYSWYKEYDRASKCTKIKYAVWSGDTMLENEEIPHENGEFPFVFRRYRIGPKPGQFYGILRNIIPLQDAINFAHLRVANLQGSIKLIVEDDMTDNRSAFTSEISKDDAVVFVRKGAVTGGKFKEIRNETKIPALVGRIRELKQAAWEVVGLNEESIGAAVNRLSGYAIDKRIDIGITSVDKFMRTSLNSDKEVMRKSIDYMQQYFDAEQEYRISDQSVADGYFIINEAVRDENGLVYENGQPVRRNRLDVGRYDLTLKAVPQTNGSRSERMEQNIETAKIVERTMPQVAPAIAVEIIKDQNPVMGAKIEKLVEAASNNQQSQDPAAQMMEQKLSIDMAEKSAKIENTQVKTAKLVAEMGGG